MGHTKRANSKRRSTHPMLTTIFLLVAFQVVASRASLAVGGKSLLLLADADTLGTDSLEETLAAAGYTVTRVTPEYTWNATNPPLDGFDCVVHLNGATLTRSAPGRGADGVGRFRPERRRVHRIPVERTRGEDRHSSRYERSRSATLAATRQLRRM